jgi:hypothetical protein
MNHLRLLRDAPLAFGAAKYELLLSAAERCPAFKSARLDGGIVDHHDRLSLS